MSSSGRKIGALPLTEDWLLGKLRDGGFVPASAKLASVEATPIGVGKGFFSHINKVVLSWEPADPAFPQSLVLKAETLTAKVEEMVASGGGKTPDDRAKKESADNMAQLAKIIHGNECTIYNKFRDSAPFPLAKTFFAQPIGEGSVGVIGMEDFAGRSTMVNIGDGLRREQLLSLAEAVAKLQAHSLNNPKWGEGIQLHDVEATAAGWGAMFKASCAQLAKMKPEWFAGLYEKLPFLHDGLIFKKALYESHAELGLPAVAAHGDLWTNNVLYTVDEASENGGGDSVVALLDWQAVHVAGNIATDLVRAVCTSSADGVRREHKVEILGHYYASLERELGGTAPFGAAAVGRAWDAVFHIGVAYALVGAPFFVANKALDGPRFDTRKESMLLRAKELVDDLLAMRAQQK